ncbi:ABC transporter ATP-binding protein [Synechococcus sp. HK05]|uniref:ABC transporter ATP-binding protein n=1 Tax=Synechococcus sp. HK05 TaxID=2725975 RepID=UPI001C38FA53|nr:ABC transporter ATP-binding protein [Synechococcus sp. HK05]MBV2352152.1 ABC transporter ATP-binding protein [Synechococcus sp. HK05]
MTAAIALQAEDLGKCYRIFPSPRARLAQGLWGERRQLYQEKWALRGVSFALPAGQTLGVVGRNGSGKSTLLQLLCGTLTPSEGTVHRQGRVAGLLELGSGFNPEFSGIENVFLNASLLGLSQQQTEDKLDAILAFADIGDYVHQPVKTYSSGMALRLAFAVQASIDPDILIVDEALAVGDELFQKKCFARLSQLKASGTSILLVTHSCAQIIQHCDQALLLHRGQAQLMGQPSLVTTTYQQLANAPDAEWAAVIRRKREQLQQQGAATAAGAASQVHQSCSPSGGTEAMEPGLLVPSSREVYASEGVEILGVSIETPDGRPRNQIPFRAAFQLRFRYAAALSSSAQALRCGCYIASTQGLRITGQVFPLPGDAFVAEPGQCWEVLFSFGGGLIPGVYFVGGGVWRNDQPGHFLHRVVDHTAFRVLASPEVGGAGLCDLATAPPELIRQLAAPPPAGT